MDVTARTERWPTRAPFRIAGYEESTAAEVAVVELRDGPYLGRGEASGVYYRNDIAAGIVAQVEAMAGELQGGITRAALQARLPAGGTRNALDCALWELEAQRAGRPVWQLAGLTQPRPLRTVFTIGIDDPGVMAEKATGLQVARALKLKLAGDGGDGERVRAVRAARPDVWLAVDANQGFTPDSFAAIVPVLVDADVRLVEQPLPIGSEADMRAFDLPMPVAADESVQDSAGLAALVGLFDVINIKLDKCGGLTHALQMEAEARRLGFRVMVGNMSGTSWAQAPGYVLGQRCDFIDLDGPTLLAGDRDPAVRYEDGYIHCDDKVWGAP